MKQNIVAHETTARARNLLDAGATFYHSLPRCRLEIAVRNIGASAERGSVEIIEGEEMVWPANNAFQSKPMVAHDNVAPRIASAPLARSILLLAAAGVKRHFRDRE